MIWSDTYWRTCVLCTCPRFSTTSKSTHQSVVSFCLWLQCMSMIWSVTYWRTCVLCTCPRFSTTSTSTHQHVSFRLWLQCMSMIWSDTYWRTCVLCTSRSCTVTARRSTGQPEWGLWKRQALGSAGAPEPWFRLKSPWQYPPEARFFVLLFYWSHYDCSEVC